MDASDNLSVTKVNGPLDINDVYVFKGTSKNHTALVMTVNPAVNLGIGPSTFAPGAEYTFNIDTNKNSRADREYEIEFGKPNSHGAQRYTVTYEKGDHEKVIAQGWTGSSKWKHSVGSFAGAGRTRSSSTCSVSWARSRERALAGSTMARSPTSSWV